MEATSCDKIHQQIRRSHNATRGTDGNAHCRGRDRCNRMPTNARRGDANELCRVPPTASPLTGPHALHKSDRYRQGATCHWPSTAAAPARRRGRPEPGGAGASRRAHSRRSCFPWLAMYHATVSRTPRSSGICACQPRPGARGIGRTRGAGRRGMWHACARNLGKPSTARKRARPSAPKTATRHLANNPHAGPTHKHVHTCTPVSLLTSSSLRGVPSGLLLSHTISPLHPTASRTCAAAAAAGARRRRAGAW